jgi:HEAT repeat protein
VLQGLALPYLPRVAESIRGRDAERRAQAVETLGELGMPDYEEAVVAALDDESPLVAMVAARRLFSPGRSVHFGAVFDRLSRFSLWSPRFLAAMFAAGGPEAAPMLRDVLEEPARTDMERVAALDALRVLHDSLSAPAAIGLLEGPVSRQLRLSALRFLEVVGQKHHAAAVRPFLTDEDSGVRRVAAGAIGALGDLSDADSLVQLLQDASPWVRVGAAEALLALGARDQLLLAASMEGPGGEVAREMVEA